MKVRDEVNERRRVYRWAAGLLRSTGPGVLPGERELQIEMSRQWLELQRELDRRGTRRARGVKHG